MGRLAFFVLRAACVLCVSPALAQLARSDEYTKPDLRINSVFVWVPALVETEPGRIASHPDLDRLRLFDNGIPEKVTRIDTDGLPISLVILLQTGGSASRSFRAYANLPNLITRLTGDSLHEITLVTFDSHVEQIWQFPTRTDGINYALTHQSAGDRGAAVKDAVAFGVQQLENEPGRFRRIVLLLSQGRDSGSSISSQALLEQLGSSSTIVYSLTFPGGERLAHLKTDKEAKSIGEALKRTNRALDGRTAAEIASLTGGRDYQFNDQDSFNSAMLQTLADFRDGITVGFQPSRHDLGFHRIQVMTNYRNARVTARRAYWRTGSD
jgi:VWFA-related protein